MLGNGSDSNVLFTGEQFALDNNRSSTGTYRCTADNGIGTAPNRTIAVGVTCKLCMDMQTKTTNGWLPRVVYTYLLFRNVMQQAWLDYVLDLQNRSTSAHLSDLC